MPPPLPNLLLLLSLTTAWNFQVIPGNLSSSTAPRSFYSLLGVGLGGAGGDTTPALPRRRHRSPIPAPPPTPCSLSSSGRRWARGAPFLSPLFPLTGILGWCWGGHCTWTCYVDRRHPASPHSLSPPQCLVFVRVWVGAGLGFVVFRSWRAGFVGLFLFAHLFVVFFGMSLSTRPSSLFSFDLPSLFCVLPPFPFRWPTCPVRFCSTSISLDMSTPPRF